ncbi:MAG TPA: bifunctional precorrin-2 dehydrogenase/sirohydrochlorin ferrochelatase [Deltaproteobacteria bacterium]|nr:bifunctional precorrin-2 dehydrogenase/sirohydrochlorin ferrochelatase [Deltaproteobacteria bacterium]HPJ93269.1 bifunctional precorrin-2 dehydrogenase/sirohydrochlorin ferrochelatase [Deltaproteobacteria bacterium]
MEYRENYYYPIFVDLRGKPVVVVGGGMVAYRKIETLLAAGAKVKVIAPAIIKEISSMREVEIVEKDYESGDLSGAVLVIAATDDESTNLAVSEDSSVLRIFCNVVDKPSLCSFIVPSIIEKGPIKIAISTGGVSPALSRKMRREIGGCIGDEFATLAMIMGKIRPLVLSREGGHENHKRIFDVLVNSQLIDAIKEGDRDLAEKILFEALGEHIDLEEIMPC